MKRNKNANTTNIVVIILAILAGAILTILIQQRLAGCVTCAGKNEQKQSDMSLYETARDSSVEILIDGYLAGSGWFVDSDGLIMTADHVIGSPGKTVEIVSHSAGRLPAKVIAVDQGHDLALLQVAQRTEGYPSLPFASEMPSAGTIGYCYGAPMFRHDVMVAGRVGRNGTTYEWFGDQQRYVELVHFSALSPKGFSGGLWINENARVIGLQSGAMVAGDSQVGVAFIIPLEAVINLAKSKTTARTPTLAIACEEMWEQPLDFRKRLPENPKGLVAKVIISEGPADKAKLQANDVIIKVDSQPVEYRDQLLTLVRSKNVGDKITLTIMKPDTHEQSEIEATLGCLEKQWLESEPKAVEIEETP